MRALTEYVDDFKRLGHAEFVSTHHLPVLVHCRDVDAEGSGALFKTTGVDEQTTQNLLRRGPRAERAVWAVAKKDGGAFIDRVSVGRTRTSDVHLDYPQVSKFHAYFHTSDGILFLTDARATNGTYLNRQRLRANEPVAVQDNNIITFGVHSFTFYWPEAFAHFIHRMSVK